MHHQELSRWKATDSISQAKLCWFESNYTKIEYSKFKSIFILLKMIYNFETLKRTEIEWSEKAQRKAFLTWIKRTENLK